MGCDRVVVVLTREPELSEGAGAADAPVPAGVPQIPRLSGKPADRAERYNQCREELFALEQEGRVLVIAPANTRGFSRTERDRQKILALWQDGFFAGPPGCGGGAGLLDAGDTFRWDTGIAADRRPSFSGRRFPLGGSGFAQEIRTAFCVLPYFYANFTKS